MTNASLENAEARRRLAWRTLLTIAVGAFLVAMLVYGYSETTRAARLEKLREKNRVLALRRRFGRTNIERRRRDDDDDQESRSSSTNGNDETRKRAELLETMSRNREREIDRLCGNVKLIANDMLERLGEVRARLVDHRYAMDEIDDSVVRIATEEREIQRLRHERSYANMNEFFLRLEKRRRAYLMPARVALTDTQRRLAELRVFTATNDAKRNRDDHDGTTRRDKRASTDNESGTCAYMNSLKTLLRDYDVKYCAETATGAE